MTLDAKRAAATVLFRVVNAAVVCTYFNPDEFWQGPEVAHRLAFGYGYLYVMQLYLNGTSIAAIFPQVLGVDAKRQASYLGTPIDICNTHAAFRITWCG